MDNYNLSKVNEPVIVDRISTFAYQAVLNIQQQQPELLNEKYRKVKWQDAKNQTLFLNKLKKEIGTAEDRKTLILKLRKFLQIILTNDFFQTNEFKLLIGEVRQLIQPTLLLDIPAARQEPKQPELTTSPVPNIAYPAQSSIAILLLDAENLQLDVETEKFLAGICTYPIQIKVAFANWRSMGKQDLEFHGRGYELIHVPPGKDSADFKMATVGSSIFVHYPNAREVLVCSSDNGLTHLCNTLQTHGLTVYRVRKQGDKIIAFNIKTAQTQSYSLKPVPEIPSIAELISQLADLIKTEQERTGLHWIKISRIVSLFHSKYNLVLSQVIATHLPGKKSKDIFLDRPDFFVVHQPSNESPVYVSLFDFKSSDKIESKITLQPNDSTSKVGIQTLSDINSAENLEKALFTLLDELTNKSAGNPIYLEVIGTEFHKQYGQSINTVIKDNLKLNGSLLKVLQSFPSFKLHKKKGKWQVAIAQHE